MSDELLLKFIEQKLDRVDYRGNVVEPDEYGEYDDDDSWYYWAWSNDDGTEVEGLGLVTTVEQFGGEGQGDRAWVVVKVEFKNGTTRFFKKDGYHASHDGTYYDGYFSEVTPQEKVVTVYE